MKIVISSLLTELWMTEGIWSAGNGAVEPRDAARAAAVEGTTTVGGVSESVPAVTL